MSTNAPVPPVGGATLRPVDLGDETPSATEPRALDAHGLDPVSPVRVEHALAAHAWGDQAAGRAGCRFFDVP